METPKFGAIYHSSPMQYAIARNGHHLGSFPEHEIREGVATGRFYYQDLVWAEGLPAWEPLGYRLGLAMPQAGPASPPLEANLGMRMLLPVGRSMWAIAAGYLGLFSLLMFPAPFAVIVSMIAIVDIRKSEHSPRGPKYGMGRAIFGLVAGLAGSVGLLFFLATMAKAP